MRVSTYLREHGQAPPSLPGPSTTTQLCALSPSLMRDLQRFEREGASTELVEVVAASMRHGRNLSIHLGYHTHVIPLTLFPGRRLVHCQLGLQRLIELRLTDLFVLQVEPALVRPPHESLSLQSDRERELFSPMGPFTWELALRGARSKLLPEIPAQGAFRVPPGVTLQGLELSGSLAAAVSLMKRKALNLRELSSRPGFDRERATRLLNALYLQSALMATCTHPHAGGVVWN